MNITLASFEQEIEEIILERGWRYYKKGHVTGIAELSPGEYEATVEGTEEYEVSFHIENNIMIDPVCTCPYEGPVCKHVTAVILYYTKEVVENDGIVGEEQLPKRKSQKKKVAKKKSTGEQVEELLKQLSADDLKSFIKEQSKRRDDFGRAFLSQYAYLSQESSKELFVKQLRSQIRSLKGRGGYIDYYQSGSVYSIGKEFHEVAASHFQQKRYLLAWHMACAALEVFTEAMEFTDDSNGDLGACITDASELMVSVANEKLSDALRRECFHYCTNAYRKQLFSGWDWHELQMDIAIQLLNSKEEATELHKLLDLVKPSGESWDYDMRQAETQRYHLLVKMDDAEKASEFLQQNLHNSDLRKHWIEQLIVAGRYDEAIRTCEEGIKKDQKELPGLADEWREKLLKVYLLKSDTDNIISYAFQLFVSSNRGGDDLYELLKAHVPAENWGAKVQQIIHAIRKNERFGSEYRIAMIYLREQYWDELFGLLRQNPSLSFLDEYEKHLPGRFDDDINQMYMEAVNKLLIENTGRKYYETACHYLRKLKKRGARELVEAKIKQLRLQYRQRRALLEELNLV